MIIQFTVDFFKLKKDVAAMVVAEFVLWAILIEFFKLKDCSG